MNSIHYGRHQRILRSPHGRIAKSGGFTLMELMIVLVIMVGALAIAWPNLQKPLGRVKLDEASQTLREAIDESRHRAIRQNKSFLIRLRKGATEVQSGSIDAFAGQRENEPRGGTRFSGDTENGKANLANESEPHVWKLPENVVVVNVERVRENTTSNSVERLTAETNSSIVTSRRQTNQSLSGNTPKEPYVAPEDLSLESDLEESDQEWWVPLNAMGVGSDAKITLLDKSTKKTIHVSYSSTTGGLEISR